MTYITFKLYFLAFTEFVPHFINYLLIKDSVVVENHNFLILITSQWHIIMNLIENVGDMAGS